MVAIMIEHNDIRVISKIIGNQKYSRNKARSLTIDKYVDQEEKKDKLLKLKNEFIHLQSRKIEQIYQNKKIDTKLYFLIDEKETEIQKIEEELGMPHE